MISLLAATPQLSAIGGPDTMEIPVPRAGDAGVYTIGSFQLDGERADIVRRNVSFAFHVEDPERVEDAYGEARRAFALRSVFLEGNDPVLGTRDHFDHRGLAPLESNVTLTRRSSTSMALVPAYWNASGAGSLRAFTNAEAPPTRTTTCGLLTELQGTRLQRGDEAPISDVCGRSLGAYQRGDETVRVTVEEIRELEQGEHGARVVMQVDSRRANLTVQQWYRTDLPYPLEVEVRGDLPADEDPERAPDEPGSVATGRVWSQLAGWIPWENLTTDQDGDGRVHVGGSMTLARFDRGEENLVPAGPRSPWRGQHRLADVRPVGAWGPQAGGETFTYSLDEAIGSVREDPELTDFHAWLDRTPDHRLALAHLRTWESREGLERQEWRLNVLGPQGDGWSITSTRATGADVGDRRIVEDAPVSENAATYEEHAALPYPQPAVSEAPTIASAIAIWRENTAAGQQGDHPRSFLWWDTGGPGALSVGHLDVDPYSLDPGGDVPLSTEVASSHVQLALPTGALSNANEYAVGWGIAPAATGSAEDTGWDGFVAPPGVERALSSPLVITLATTGGLALLFVLLAKLGLLPFYSRLSRDDLLDSDARRHAYEAIQETPGSSLSGVATEAGIARSTARYHVRRLAEGGLIRSVKGPDARRFFPANGTPLAELERLVILEVGRTREVYDAIQEEPGSSLKAVSEATGIAPSSAHRIVERLEEAGLVEKRPDGRAIALHIHG